jgi:hypothetical protein
MVAPAGLARMSENDRFPFTALSEVVEKSVEDPTAVVLKVTLA